jgi:hypothetical protein
VIAHYLWKQEPGELPPGYPEKAKTEVARVYVLIPRLSNTSVTIVDDKEVHAKPDRVLPNSYDFVMRMNDEGSLDLPGVNVLEGETLRAAAERALRLVKVSTWPHPNFIEPLYTAYTPRGRLASVMLVTAWRLEEADAIQDGLDWRKWPISGKETPMAGFYKALETVWAMRVFQHNRASSRTEEISVRVRGSGSKYIALQQLLRLDTKNLDMSMVEIMRRNMTDDEKMIDKLLGEHEILSRELAIQKKADAQAAGEEEQSDEAIRAKLSRGEQVLVKGNPSARVETESGEGSSGEVEVSGDENTTQSEESDSLLEATADDTGSGDTVEEEEEEEEEVVPVGPPPEGFARMGKELSMKKVPK